MDVERAMNSNSSIYVAGHCGLVGSAIWRELEVRGYKCLLGKTRQELDLLDTNAVQRFYRETQPEFVFMAAARVGGILANVLQLNFGLGPVLIRYEELICSIVGGLALFFAWNWFKSRKQSPEVAHK